MRLTFIALLFIIGLAILYASDPAPYPNIPAELKEEQNPSPMEKLFPKGDTQHK